MRLRPLGKQILCERLPANEMSPGGIAIFDRAPTSSARVVAVGPKVEGIRPGEIITFLKSQYEISQFEGKEVLFVNFDNVITTQAA